MLNLWDFIHDANLQDLDFLKNMISWNNKRGGKANEQQRNDIGLATNSWCRVFSQVVHHLDATGLNNCDLLLVHDNLAYFGKKIVCF